MRRRGRRRRLATSLFCILGCSPKLEPRVPANTQGLAVGNRAFHDHSWRSFVAVNWPAHADQIWSENRGRPDAALSPGASARLPVWRTWKQDFELFPRDPDVPTDPTSAAQLARFLDRSNVPRPTAWNELAFAQADQGVCKGASEGALQLSAKVEQAVAGRPLLDRDGREVRYSVHVNQAYYDTVVSEGWYRKTLPPSGPKVKLPHSSRLRLDRGAIVVKAAWKVLDEKQATDIAFADRFYVEDALLAPIGSSTKLAAVECTKAKVALIGIHIMQKTAARRQWFWSTFEHADVVAGPCPLFRGTKESEEHLPGCRPAEPNSTELVRRAAPSKPDQHTKMDASMAARSSAYGAELENSVWSNYRLVGTQWPGVPIARGRQDDPQDGPTDPPWGRREKRDAARPIPLDSVANLTMEAFFQVEDRDKKHLGSSCLQCHHRASHWDYSFLLWQQGFANTDDFEFPPPPR